MKRLGLLAIVLSVALVVSAGAVDLEAGFHAPPDTARPHTWWHWINGNISRDGITKDLEAMQAAGIRGVQLFNVSMGPAGPVKFMSPEWHELFVHAMKEASRLGLEVCLHNCPGWSSSGGPWNTPENAMQMVVWSERQITGPGSVSEALPQPHTRFDYYRDIAVLAFPTPPREMERLSLRSPLLNAGTLENAGSIFDGDSTTYARIQAQADGRTVIDIACERPLEASCLTLISGPSRFKTAELLASDDGQDFRSIASFTTAASYVVEWENTQWQNIITFPTTIAQHFRIEFRDPEKADSQVTISELDLHGGYRIDGWPGKAGYDVQYLPGMVVEDSAPKGAVIAVRDIINLTKHLGKDGRLDWAPPPGNWTILRIGYTPTGRMNGPAPLEGTGLECDKLSRDAVNAHWDAAVEPLIQEVKGVVPATFNNVLIDSYETGPQNWTPRFAEEFARLRGYEIGPWLLTVTGRVVEDLDKTGRFLWDFRKTIADLWAENYFGTFKQRLDAHGMQLSIESYGNGGFDYLQGSTRADIPMTEFWAGGAPGLETTKMAASATHLLGKPYLAAESFTAGPEAWGIDLYDIKPMGDLLLTLGVNRYIFHSYVHQPTDRAPGMTLGPFGMPFQRLNTWWAYMPTWTDYIARCQYMLQQGRYVADVLYSLGETPALNEGIVPRVLPPAGYSYDLCDSKTLLDLTSVKEGQLVLPSGMKYQVLVLPDNGVMSPAMARKIRELVKEGAKVLGPKPSDAPGLTAYPRAGAQVRRIAEKIWNDKTKETTALKRKDAQGKVFDGIELQELLDELGIAPDFSYDETATQLAWLHRSMDDADIYFISNQHRRSVAVRCSFRISGKQPEIWRPEADTIEPVPFVSEENGRTTVMIDFAPAESVFVVFRSPAPTEHLTRLTIASDSAKAKHAQLNITKAAYGHLPDPRGTQDVTDLLNEKVVNNLLSIAVGKALVGDPAPGRVKQLRVEYIVDGTGHSVTVSEGALLGLPEDSGYETGPIIAAKDRGWELTVWEAGQYTVETSGGESITVPVNAVPEAIAVTGPWQLKFPSDERKSDTATMDKLVSWTESEDIRLHSFSGTARYSTKFSIDSDTLTADQVLVLDLGKVKNMATVRLNGAEVGAFWKPPFAADVTLLLQSGENQLEVEVTNLWTNRLLADAQLSKETRSTWTTFNPFAPGPEYQFIFELGAFNDIQKNPSECGLLGPVRLVVGRRVQVAAEHTD